MEFKIGQKIKWLSPMSWEITGKIIEIDSHPFDSCLMKIKVEGLPFRGYSEAWVDAKYCSLIKSPKSAEE